MGRYSNDCFSEAFVYANDIHNPNKLPKWPTTVAAATDDDFTGYGSETGF